MAECLNAAAKENLPLLFVVIDNGRAINTFTPDVAANSDVLVDGVINFTLFLYVPSLATCRDCTMVYQE